MVDTISRIVPFLVYYNSSTDAQQHCIWQAQQFSHSCYQNAKEPISSE
jgi:hypothetical protein